MNYDSGQASAEFILLFGGIIVVVLLAIFMYRNYINELGGEVKSKEVNELNGKLNEISEFFT
ncbi:MAG: class III signal peptide-containing protein [Methanobrevibacter sp.]|nr:class III signal peptide-containing protein [Methanobrevibacter sp.]